MVQKVILVCGYMRTGKTTVATYYKQKHGAQVFAFADSLKAISYDVLRRLNFPVNSLEHMELMKEQKTWLIARTERAAIWAICAVIGLLAIYAPLKVLVTLLLSLAITFWSVFYLLADKRATAGANYRTVRDVLIQIGTSMRQHIDRDIFIKGVHNAILCTSDDSLIVIQDCRFVNEIEYFDKCADAFELSVIYIRRWVGDQEVKPDRVDPSEMPDRIVEYATAHGIRVNHVNNSSTLERLYANLDLLV